MQSLSVKKGFLKDVIHLPSSKSYANRALILASLQKKPVTLSQMPAASDVTILIRCLKDIGVSITTEGDKVTVHNSFPECETTNKEVTVGEGGTTGRFLAALLLLGTKTYTLNLGERLKQRPWQEFIDQVNALGASATLSEDKLILKGPIHFPESLKVDCSKTTQFATAFQLIAPASVKIVPVNMQTSQSYWRMTEKLIQELKSDFYAVPLDWSSASYPLAFAALKQRILFPGLVLDEFQADSKFLGILKQFGSVTESRSGIEISPFKKTMDVNFDVSDALDLVPALSFFLSHIEGQHTLTGIENLVHKESDRLNEVIKLLAQFNRKSWVEKGNLHIVGTTEIVNQKVDLKLPDDHRMVMTGTLFLLLHGGGSVTPSEAVNKSYPDFFETISEK
jgi:3-phosphoshikimate 1-carboxyvinyltransferase